ncbi:MAG: acyltransferase [Bacteroidales bacterium]|nr:acyltransferase [Bacteroidales bacterium]
MEKKRIEFIDLAKGFCILLVVAHHVSTDYAVCQVGTLFRMPLYYFLSGLFFKTYGSFADFTIKKINRLIIPMVFFYAIGKALGHLNVPYWFLLSLFEVNIMSYWLIKIAKDKTWLVTTLFFAVGAVGYTLGRIDIKVPLYIGPSLTCAPFFIVGYLLRKKTSLLYPNNFDKYWILTFIACIAVVVVTFMTNGDMVSIITNRIPYNIVAFYVAALCGIMGVLTIAKRIGHMPYISYIGRYSIILLGTHFLVTVLIREHVENYFGKGTLANDVVLFLLCVAICSILIPVLTKTLPWFTAQKDLIKWPLKNKD